jgi:hypothetical protein
LTEQSWQTFLQAITTRVELKSPVRENCTPGSVRGAPGNRRPYLDKMPEGEANEARENFWCS